MSALDQAFIRAYAKGPAQLASTEATSASEAQDALPAASDVSAAPPTPHVSREAGEVPQVAWRIDDPGWGPTTPLPAPPSPWGSHYGHDGHPYSPSFVPPRPPEYLSFHRIAGPPATPNPWLPMLSSPSALGYTTEPPAAPTHRFDGPQAHQPPAPHFVVTTDGSAAVSEELPQTIASLDLPATPLVAATTFDPTLLAAIEAGDETPLPSASCDTACAAEPDARSTENATFRPRWEVDGFEWPSTCERLLAERRDDWQRLVAQLMTGRTTRAALVGLAGCMRGDGKSTVALCLAKAAAEAGWRVALVDADFDHPDLGERLRVEVREGFEAALEGTATLAEVTVAAADLKLNLLPLGGSVDASPAEIAVGLADTLELLSEHHDLVLVDLGTLPAGEAVLPPPPSLAIALQALIVRDGRAGTAERLAAACSHLRSAGLEVVGVVDNFRAAEGSP